MLYSANINHARSNVCVVKPTSIVSGSALNTQTRRKIPPTLRLSDEGFSPQAWAYSMAIFQHMRDGGGAQRSLPVAADAPDGALGQTRLHPHPATPPGDAQAAISV
jgi:hypothetical protein